MIYQILLHKIKIFGKNVSSNYVDSGGENILLSLAVALADFAPLCTEFQP